MGIDWEALKESFANVDEVERLTQALADLQVSVDKACVWLDIALVLGALALSLSLAVLMCLVWQDLTNKKIGGKH